jgi:hypothetical protein
MQEPRTDDCMVGQIDALSFELRNSGPEERIADGQSRVPLLVHAGATPIAVRALASNAKAEIDYRDAKRNSFGAAECSAAALT